MLCIKSGICQALPRLRRPLICGGKTDSIYQIPQVLKIVVLPLPSCPELSVVLFQWERMFQIFSKQNVTSVRNKIYLCNRWNVWSFVKCVANFAYSIQKDVLSLHLKISQEHIFLNSHSYIDTRPVILEVSVFSVMVFICLSRQKFNFVSDKNTYLRKLFLFFGLILQNNNKSYFLLFSYQSNISLFCSNFLAFEDHKLF